MMIDEAVERAAFEAWAKEYGRIFLGKTPFETMKGERYTCAWTQEAWVGWQARAELQKPALHEPVTDAKWHTPGIGEVHSSDHKQMIYCEAMNSDGEMVVSDTLAEKIAAALQANAAAVEPVTIADKASIESSCKFIEEHIAPRKCDSPALSQCWHCNSVYLAKRMRDFLVTTPVPARAQEEITDEQIQRAYFASIKNGGGQFSLKDSIEFVRTIIRASKGEKT